MALGGGTFVSQNKTLPGAYINIISAASGNPSAADRGVAAIALNLDWGPEGEIITLTNTGSTDDIKTDFLRNSKNILGFGASDEKLKCIREILLHLRRLYIFRAAKDGVKAKNTLATAKYPGIRGNSLKTAVTKASLDGDVYTVDTYLGTEKVDSQTVKTSAELKSNDFVDFNSVELSENESAGEALTGGTNGATAAHDDFLAAAESFPDINAIGYDGEDDDIKTLYVNFAKNMRENYGVKMQAVLFNKKADSEAVINVKNCKELVYWVLGTAAGTAVNASALNMLYDGEYDIPASYTREELEAAIENGEFALHKVGTDLRVLADINSLVTVSDEKGEIFKDNQTVRIVDNIAVSIANIFNTKYLGRVLNDESGRESLKGDIINVFKSLVSIRAIEEFDENDITVEKGDAKNSIVVSCAAVTATAMAKLYMVCVIS